MPSALHFVFTVAGTLLALTAFPLLAELLCLSLASLFATRNTRIAAPSTLSLAVIIPAHNEELLVATCVRSLLESSNPNITIYVIAHNCTDQTATQAREAGAQVLVLDDDVGGKGTALDHGFRHALAAGAGAVLVIDADSTVSPNLTAAVAARLAAGAAALQCRYQVANPDGTPQTRLAALAFLGMNVLRPRGRDRLGLSCGILGNGFALTAGTLRAVPYTANSLVEDLEYHLHLIDAGLRVEFLDTATVFGEMPDTSSAAATQRARWEGGRILMRKQWTSPLVHKVLRGQLRMLEPLLDLLALPLASEAVLLVAIALCAPLCTWPAASIALSLYAAAGLVSVALYLIVAALLGPSPRSSLAALTAAPTYMLWKILLIPRTRLAARSNATWVRTKRNLENHTDSDKTETPSRLSTTPTQQRPK